MSKDEIFELVITNVIIQQSDGFQQGYGEAITDIIDNMIDYTKGSDDELTRDFLYALVDMGESLAKKKRVAEDNLAEAKKRGYTENFVWRTKETFASANIFVKDSDKLEDDEAIRADERKKVLDEVLEITKTIEADDILAMAESCDQNCSECDGCLTRILFEQLKGERT